MPSGLTKSYRGRFAPSPTGRLHFGSLVAAVASYAQARALQGQWIVRMEDLDRPREVPGMAEALLSDLAAFGMVSDEPVLYQSKRDSAYSAALTQLQQRQLTFSCSCSRRDLSGMTVYPGNCRNGVLKPGPTSTRIKAADRLIQFDDLVMGAYSQNIAADVGDFIVKRVDGLFAYQLAVVVDDGFQRITEVVRGEDLLASTPRQIYLQQLLGLPTLDYLHLPLALHADGSKLSKQTKAQPIDTNNPVKGLVSAWRFLGQQSFAVEPDGVMSFWSQAAAAWLVRRIPQTSTVP